MRLVDSSQIQEMDRFTIEDIGVPGIVLMENAARSWVAAAEPVLKQAATIIVFCGAGNNGGDGYAIARNLISHRYNCFVVAVKPPKSADCIRNAAIWEAYGETKTWKQYLKTGDRPTKDDVLVDAILGTGIETNIRGPLGDILQQIDGFSGIKMAVDLPSGINASNGNLLGVGIRCDHSITFQVEKVGHHLYPGKSYSGTVTCQKITIREDYTGVDPAYHLVTGQDVHPLLPKRNPDDYKNRFGHLAVLCGTSGTMGAAFLASHGAIKTGLGLLTAVLPKSEQHVFLSAAPELMSYPQEKVSDNWLKSFDALVVGCGLGRNREKWKKIETLLQKNSIPSVIDADGFYGIQNWKDLNLKNRILTPHPGEFAQLSGWEKPADNKEKIEQGLAFVSQYPCTLVLKGAPTLIFSMNRQVFINSTGNVGMATAGSGDVLAGIIGGLLAQGTTPLDAALLGVWLHGKSGDLYRDQYGEESLTAPCLINHLGAAIEDLKVSSKKV